MKNKNGLTQEEFLAQYDASKWERPSVTVDIMLYAAYESSVLLIRRGDHPFINTLAMPGGFVEPTETVYDAAKRELFEETSVNISALKQVKVYSDPNRDPRTRIITVFYAAIIDHIIPVTAGDDAAAADWYKVDITSDANGGEVTLTNGDEHYKYRYSKRQESAKYPVDCFYTATNAPLASDHGAMLAEGLEYAMRNCNQESGSRNQ